MLRVFFSRWALKEIFHEAHFESVSGQQTRRWNCATHSRTYSEVVLPLLSVWWPTHIGRVGKLLMYLSFLQNLTPPNKSLWRTKSICELQKNTDKIFWQKICMWCVVKLLDQRVKTLANRWRGHHVCVFRLRARLSVFSFDSLICEYRDFAWRPFWGVWFFGGFLSTFPKTLSIWNMIFF